MNRSSPLTAVLAFASAVLACADVSQAQPKGTAPFPAQQNPGIKWFDSLAKGIQEASAARKPICLILAGQRPSGDC